MTFLRRYWQNIIDILSIFFLEMPFISFYLAISLQFLVPVPGSRDLSSVVYGGLTSCTWSYLPGVKNAILNLR